jgi:glycosyltransferase involved in cell wall biosynthesis
MPAGEVISFMEEHPEFLLCLVDDCSTDQTGDLLRSVEKRFPGRVILINLEKNMGKAEAVRRGVLASLAGFQFGFIGYFDADLSTPLQECFRLKNGLDTEETMQFSFGSRLAIIGSKIDRKLHRHLLGRIIATLISNILRLKVYDTQCGAKLFKRELAAGVFSDPFYTTWLFDVEIFARIIRMFGRGNIEHIMIETPLMQWSDKGGSKIEPTYAIKVFYDLYRIRKRYFGKGR